MPSLKSMSKLARLSTPMRWHPMTGWLKNTPTKLSTMPRNTLMDRFTLMGSKTLLLKRGISGTYVSVEPFHLFRYLDEQMFRYNNRSTKEK